MFMTVCSLVGIYETNGTKIAQKRFKGLIVNTSVFCVPAIQRFNHSADLL